MATKAAKPSLRDRQRELTRQSIFDAALEAFGEKGYFLVTVDDIVGRAGVSRATFYLHFDSKAAVLRALRESRLADWSPANNPRWGLGERDSIKAFLEKVIEFYLEAPVLNGTLHEARAADPEFAAEHRVLMERSVADWLASDLLPGVPLERVRLMTLMIYSMLDYFIYVWLIQGWELDNALAIEAMTDALYAVMH
jgi:AcrR family transcriptional regulator